MSSTLRRLARAGAWGLSGGLLVSRWSLFLSSSAAASVLTLSSLATATTAAVIPSLLPGASYVRAALSTLALSSSVAKASLSASALSAQSSLLAMELGLRTGTWALSSLAAAGAATASSSSAPPADSAPAAAAAAAAAAPGPPSTVPSPRTAVHHVWTADSTLDGWLFPALAAARTAAPALDYDVLHTALRTSLRSARIAPPWSRTAGLTTLQLAYALAHSSLAPGEAKTDLETRTLSGASALAALAALHAALPASLAPPPAPPPSLSPPPPSPPAPLLSSSSSWWPFTWSRSAPPPSDAPAVADPQPAVDQGALVGPLLRLAARYMPMARAAYGEAALIGLSNHPTVAPVYASLGDFFAAAGRLRPGDSVVVASEDVSGDDKFNFVLAEEGDTGGLVLALGAPRGLGALLACVGSDKPAALDDGRAVLAAAHDLASRIVARLGDDIVARMASGARSLIVTGHSLGASAAALTALYLAEPILAVAPDAIVRAFAFGPLPFVSASFAASPIVAKYVVAVVTSGDALPAATPGALTTRLSLPLTALLNDSALAGALALGDVPPPAAALLSSAAPHADDLAVGGTVVVVASPAAPSPPAAPVPFLTSPAILASSFTLTPTAFSAHTPNAYADACAAAAAAPALGADDNEWEFVE